MMFIYGRSEAEVFHTGAFQHFILELLPQHFELSHQLPTVLLDVKLQGLGHFFLPDVCVQDVEYFIYQL